MPVKSSSTSSGQGEVAVGVAVRVRLELRRRELVQLGALSRDLNGPAAQPGSVGANGPATTALRAAIPSGALTASDVGDLLTVNLTLAAPPSAASATTCAAGGEVPAVADGGFWGAEWWSSAGTDTSGATGNDNFYLAYIDQAGSTPRAEAGRLNRSSFPSLTGNEPRFVEPATLGGNCTGPLPPSPCTLTLTASMSGLGIKQGGGLYSLSGESLYITGHADTVPFTNVEEGYSSLGDITAAIDYNGTGTTP